MPDDDNAPLLHVIRIEAGGADARRLELGLDLMGAEITAWHAADTDRVVFEDYAPSADEAVARLADLRERLADWLPENHWVAAVHTLRAEDWSETWKRFFHVCRVSERIVIKPSWEAATAREGDCIIELDPGLSFGTGQHPTTRGCLRFIDRLARERPASGLLDMGCGSGILAIAAAKLGLGPVVGVDVDAVAIETARANAQRNGVASQVELSVGDISTAAARGTSDIVVANILADVLERWASALCACVSSRAGAQLILSGILTRQYDALSRQYEALGFRQCESLTEGEWTSGCFARVNSGS